MGRSLGCPHGAPMDLHCYCFIGAAWKSLMHITFGIPHVASMVLDGGGIIGNSMEWLYGQCIGIPWTCIGGCSLRSPWKWSMGRSLGCPPGTPMELHCYCSIGAAWKCLVCNTFGIPHVASMGLDGD